MRIHGYVIARQGTPVESATVCGLATLESCCRSEQCVNTDRDGRFAFPEQEMTPLILAVSASGYATGVHAIEAGAQGAARGQEIRLELDAGGVSLMGAVYDLYGGAIAGAVVSVSSDLEGERGGVTLSTADGSFELTVRRGEGRLCAHAEAYSRVCSDILAPSQGNTLVLMPQSAIVGRIVTAMTGEAVAGAMVSASNANGLRVPTRTAHSRTDGSFAFDALPAGGYSIAAVSEHGRSAEAWVALGVGETSKPVLLTAFPAVRLRATVLLGERPCPDGLLELSGPINVFEHLSSEGTISIDGLLPGAYRAVAVCHGLPRGTLLDVTDRPVHHVWTFQDDAESPASENPDVRNPEESVVARGGIIKVTVSDPLTSAGPIRVFANARSPMPLRARQIGAEFIFDDLPNGEYRVHPFDDVEQARSVRIHRSGEVVEVQLALRERGTISGRVLDNGGLPVADAWVSHSRADLPAGEELMDAPVLADLDGTFAIGATVGAPYSIVVNSPAGDARIQGVQSGQHIEIHVPPPAVLSASEGHALGEPGDPALF